MHNSEVSLFNRDSDCSVFFTFATIYKSDNFFNQAQCMFLEITSLTLLILDIFWTPIYSTSSLSDSRIQCISAFFMCARSTSKQ